MRYAGAGIMPLKYNKEEVQLLTGSETDDNCMLERCSRMLGTVGVFKMTQLITEVEENDLEEDVKGSLLSSIESDT